MAALLATGCAASQLRLEPWAAEETLPEVSSPDGTTHPAIILLDRSRYLFERRNDLADRWQKHRLVVVAVLTEAGVGHANVALNVQHGERVTGAMARTIHPDGTVVEHDVRDLRGLERDDDPRFEIPDAEVGTRVEVQYLVEGRRLPQWLFHRVARTVPVRRYELEIRGSRYIRYAVTGFGTREPFEIEDEGRDWRIRWVLEDVPPRVSETDAPHWSRHEPWWLYRLRQYAHDRWTWNRQMDWDDVIRHDFARHVQTDLPDDAKAEVERAIAACDTVACRLEAVVDWVHDRSVLVRSESRRARASPLDDVLERGKATASEKASLILAGLEIAGVSAHPAMVHLERDLRFHPDLPFEVPFRGVIVKVPAQEGLIEDVWIDSSCESCTPGELLSSNHDRPALVFDPAEHVRVGDGFETTAGRLFSHTKIHRSIHHRILPEGTSEMFVREVLTGPAALATALSNDKGEDEDEDEDDLYPPLPVGGDSLREIPWTCDRRAARCEREHTFVLRRFTPIGGGLLEMRWRPSVTSPPVERTQPYIAIHDWTWIHEVRYTPPDGWRVITGRPTLELDPSYGSMALVGGWDGDDWHEEARGFQPRGTWAADLQRSRLEVFRRLNRILSTPLVLRPIDEAATLPDSDTEGDSSTPEGEAGEAPALDEP